MSTSLQDLYNKEVTKPKLTKLQVAIHENLTTKMNRGTSENNGNSYTEITFTNGEGLFHREWIWDPNGSAFRRKDETQTQADKRETDLKENQYSQILKAIVPFEEVVKINKPNATFQDNAKMISDLVNRFGEKKTVNIKLVYDKKGQWPQFPNWETEFVETYTANTPTVLVYDQWEAENRTTRKFIDEPKTEDLFVNKKESYDIV